MPPAHRVFSIRRRVSQGISSEVGKLRLPRSLIEVLVLALLVRLWAMHWSPFPGDMRAWIAWGEWLLNVGPRNFYNGTFFIDYAPGYLYALWFVAAAKHAFFPAAGTELYTYLFRLIPSLFDLATTALIFSILRSARRRRIQDDARGAWLPVLGAACYAFNPAIILNSAVWGQVDAVFTFWMLLALALFLRSKPATGAAAYVLALLIKPQAVALAPLLAVVLLMCYPPRSWLYAGAVGLALAFGILYPFFGWHAFPRLISLLQHSVDAYPYTSMFTYNLWGIYGFWKDDRLKIVFGLSLRMIGTSLYVVGLLYGVWLLVRQLRNRRENEYKAYIFASYFTWLPVTCLTRMHERYLYPVLPCLLIAAILCSFQYLSSNRRISFPLLTIPSFLFIAVTLLHTLNLYQVYTFYIHYDAGTYVDRSNTFFYFVDDNARLWSVLTVVAFLGIGLTLPSEYVRTETDLLG